MQKNTVFEFSRESSFLLDLRKKNYSELIKDIDDFNSLIPTEGEISILDAYIEGVRDTIINTEEDGKEFEILPEFKNALQAFIPGIRILNTKYTIIKTIIQNFKKKENISLKNICKKYKKETNTSISKSSVYYILKNKLNYGFLRTTTKTNKLNDLSSKRRAFIFIKAIINCLKLKIKIIYLDETHIQLENNHLKIWRPKNMIPYFNSGKRGRKNFLMAVTIEGVILYEINDDTNNQETFYSFMVKLIEKINKEELNNYLIIMENCSIHLTKKLKDFYSEKKLKILTIVPYLSEFNAIELFFNYIKQKIYKKVFNSFNKLITFIEGIINGDNITEILPKIFIRTIDKYKEFLNNNKNIDLN